MSTLLEARPVNRGTRSARHLSRRRAVAPLARAEGRRLVRHPIFLGGLVLAGAVFYLLTRGKAPVLQRDDIATAASLLPVTGATFLVSNMAALRSRRHGTDELYDTTAAPATARTLGHLLSVGWAVGVASLVVAVEMAYLVARGPVGTPDPLEMATGPAMVAVAGAMGVCFARWWPTIVAGPIAVIGLGALQFYMLTRLPGGTFHQFRLRWLAPWVPLAAGGADPPRELVIRPTGWHLLYLLGLLVVPAALSVLRHGVRPRPAALAASGLALTILAAVVQTRPPTAAQQQALLTMALHPARYQVCETRGPVRYCAFPGYAQWIDRWADPVGAALSPIPASARPAGLVVRQQFSNVYATTLPRRAGDLREKALAGRSSLWTIYTGTEWGEGGPAGEGASEGDHQLGLALTVAAWSLGFPRAGPVALTDADIDRLVGQVPRKQQGRERRLYEAHRGNYGSCGAIGQARAVVVLWLAARATPLAEASLRRIVAEDPYGLMVFRPPGGSAARFGDNGPMQYGLYNLRSPVAPFSPVGWGKAEVNYALQLLDRPGSEVASIVARNWEVLSDPATKTARAIDLFHLDRLPTLQEQLEEAGAGPAKVKEFLGPDHDFYQVPCR